jgi:hypothetical protein
MTGNELAVLKQDGKGRVRTTVARREQLLEEFGRSGLSAPKFAALVGVKYQTFATWVQKRKQPPGALETARVPPSTTEKVKWLEAVLEATPQTAGHAPLVLQLPAGVRLELSDAKQVPFAAALIRALEQPC